MSYFKAIMHLNRFPLRALRRSRRAAAADFFVAPPPPIFGHRRAAAAAADFLVGAPPRSISKSQFSAGQCYEYLDRQGFEGLPYLVI